MEGKMSQANPFAPAWARNQFSRIAVCFLAGAVLWLIPGYYLSTIVSRGYSTGQLQPLQWVMIIWLLADVVLAWKGWPFLSEYRFGSIGGLIKWMLLVFIAITGVGLVFHCYWTGRFVLQGYLD